MSRKSPRQHRSQHPPIYDYPKYTMFPNDMSDINTTMPEETPLETQNRYSPLSGITESLDTQLIMRVRAPLRYHLAKSLTQSHHHPVQLHHQLNRHLFIHPSSPTTHT